MTCDLHQFQITSCEQKRIKILDVELLVGRNGLSSFMHGGQDLPRFLYPVINTFIKELIKNFYQCIFNVKTIITCFSGTFKTCIKMFYCISNICIKNLSIHCLIWLPVATILFVFCWLVAHIKSEIFGIYPATSFL